MKIIDNFLSKEEFKELKDTIISDSFPFYFSNYVSDFSEKKDVAMLYFLHTVYTGGNPTSECFPLIAKNLLSKLNILSLLRIKINCYPRTEKIISHGKHKDFSNNHKGSINAVLFSLNTCNGSTVLENGTEVKSVANRALFFDCMTIHNSTSCTDKKARFNININYF